MLGRARERERERGREGGRDTHYVSVDLIAVERIHLTNVVVVFVGYAVTRCLSTSHPMD